MRHRLEKALRNPFRWLESAKRTGVPSGDPKGGVPDVPRRTREEFWALKDVSFEVRQGDVVGIIGRNGAGKSTLLKILSRITEPTQGRIRLRGRVASLLEVGTGFHQELTGRENIFLNGAILGMTRREIRQKFDEIVAFSEVEKFLDTPVKRYSSGMYVRLAFAVAAHLEPEILIVDEVLAVGDAAFQKKCLGKMGEVAKGGRTVLFVSHNMPAVEALCHKAIYLQAGTVKAMGEVEPLVHRYLLETGIEKGREFTGTIELGESLRLRGMRFLPNPVTSGEPLRFSLDFFAEKQATLSELAMLIYSAQSIRVAILDFRLLGMPLTLAVGEVRRIVGEIESLPLVDGEYSVGLFATARDFTGNVMDLSSFTVRAKTTNRGHAPYGVGYRGIVELDYTVSVISPSRAWNGEAVPESTSAA